MRFHAEVGGHNAGSHSTVWETHEEACTYVADWCKAVHPPASVGGRMWGPHRHGNVTEDGVLRAKYWRATRGDVSKTNEFVKHIGNNVMRVFITDEYLAAQDAKRVRAPKIGTMKEEIARANRGERGTH